MKINKELKLFVLIAVTVISCRACIDRIIYEKKKKVMITERYFDLMEEWMVLREKGINLVEYLLINGYKKIAIYGMGQIGMHLYHELKNSKIRVAYAITKKESMVIDDLQVYGINNILPEVDAVIVTNLASYEQIEKKLYELCDCEVLAFEDIINDCQGVSYV